MLLLHIGSKADNCIDEALILTDGPDSVSKALREAADYGVSEPYIESSEEIDEDSDLARSLAVNRVFIG